jgi:hypothetical protein
MKSDEEIINEVIRWHPNDDLNNAVMGGLAALLRMGFADQAAIEDAPLDYIRNTCAIVSATVGSMPAVQRALALANPGYNQEECYNELVRAIAKVFILDEEAVLAAVKPTPSRPQPGKPTAPMAPGPAN